MEAIIDDAPSNSIRFPEILFIQETIIKNMTQSLQNGSDVFCLSYTAKCKNCRSKNVVEKLSQNAWALNPHSQIITFASSPLHHETTERESYSFHYIQHASPCHFKAKSAGLRRKIDGFSKIVISQK